MNSKYLYLPRLLIVIPGEVMEQRAKRSSSIDELVHKFETSFSKGELPVSNEENLFNIISYYEKEKEYDKALDVVNLAIEQFKYQVDFYLAKTRLLLKKNKIKEAQEILKNAESLAPGEVEISILNAIIYCEKYQYNAALQLLEQISDDVPPVQQARVKLCVAYVFEHMKDFDKMFQVLQEALAIDPENQEALEKIWVSVELSKKYEESVEFHHTFINDHPYAYLAWYNLGQAYSSLGEYDKAIEALEYSFLINEFFEMGYRDCADICMQVQNFPKAIQILYDIIGKFGVDEETLVNISECHIHLNQYFQAKKILIKAVKLDPYNDEIYYLLGQCFSKEEKWHYAINAYRRALDLEDRREEFHAGLAQAYVKTNNLKAALSHLVEATRLAPDQYIYWAELVKFFIHTHQLIKAEKALNKADQACGDTEIIFMKGLCLFLNNQVKTALELFADGLKENYDAHNVLQLVYPQILEEPEVKAMLRYYHQEE